MATSSIIFITFFVAYTSSMQICEPDYIVSTKPLTRFQAFQYCKEHGSNLVSFSKEGQRNEVLRVLHQFGQKHLYYWMDGLSYWKHDRSKWWFDDSHNDIHHTNWCMDKNQPQEPSGTNTYAESCIALNFRGNSSCWHDYPCFTELPFVCATQCRVMYPSFHIGEFCVYTDEPKTAFEADEECQQKSFDHTLVIINNKLKYSRIFHFLREFGIGGNYYWSSLKRDAEDKDEWYWNSTRGFYADWANWRPGQPNDRRNSDCVVVRRTAKAMDFDDKPCTEKYPYICE